MANNTGLEADSQHQLGSVSCHSASRQPNIGRWVTPSGDDISLSGNEVFAVEYYNGGFPSYTVLSLRPGTLSAGLGTSHLLLEIYVLELWACSLL